METNELKKIWQTLSDKKLIDKSIAKENIERIIKLKSSKTIEKLSKKLRADFLIHIATSLFIVVIAIFATIFLHFRDQSLPLQGYLFLILTFSFYTLKALSIRSKMKLIHISYNTLSLLDSLKMVKNRFEKISKKESMIVYISILFLTLFANYLINDKTDFSNFAINSLQGYVLIFSICYLISLPWIGTYFIRKKFSGIITDINNSIEELTSEG